MKDKIERKDKPETTTVKKIVTEDLGKQFEMAICISQNIAYKGPFKYSLQKPEQLAPRIKTLLDNHIEQTVTFQHTAEKGGRYDFTSPCANHHLSAKTSKHKQGMVAPQCIGQAQPQKFCMQLNIPFVDIPTLKQYLQENIHTVLPHITSYTFDCPILYYNETKNRVSFIKDKSTSTIKWDEYSFVWTAPHQTWNNSSTLKLVNHHHHHQPNTKPLSLLEIQFHTKSRTNMAVRWHFDNFLYHFSDYLEISVDGPATTSP